MSNSEPQTQVPSFGEVAERLRRSTVEIKIHHGRAIRGGGSGVIWTADGLIVTNAHVARGSHATVALWDGREFPARVVQRDARRDLAELRIAAAGLPAAIPGDSAALRPGELVMAVGNPLGFVGALSTGVVHSQGALRGLGSQPWVQAAVRLAPGNSGGPLADAQGRVVGINTMIVAGGLALAVPGAAVARFLDAGPATPAIGVTVRPVRARDGLGLLILEVEPNGPADRASLLPGDVLIGAGGRRLRSFEEFGDALAAARSKGSITVEFLRGDRRAVREVAVQLPQAVRLPRGCAAA